MINLTLDCFSLFQNYAGRQRTGILSDETLQADRHG